MTAPDHFDEVDDSCPNCDGSGWVGSCFEDTCVCLDPPCHQSRCDWCNHRGTQPAPPIDPVHGGDRPTAAPGPLLLIMEGSK